MPCFCGLSAPMFFSCLPQNGRAYRGLIPHRREGVDYTGMNAEVILGLWPPLGFFGTPDACPTARLVYVPPEMNPASRDCNPFW